MMGSDTSLDQIVEAELLKAEDGWDDRMMLKVVEAEHMLKVVEAEHMLKVVEAEHMLKVVGW
jgi:hypothetical protein